MESNNGLIRTRGQVWLYDPFGLQRINTQFVAYSIERFEQHSSAVAESNLRVSLRAAFAQ